MYGTVSPINSNTENKANKSLNLNISKNQNSKKFDITCKIKDCKRKHQKLIPFLSYIEYTILVKTNKKSWEIKRRYKDFDELHITLQKNNIKNLPKLPEKALFISENIIKERKIKLQKYLNSLLRRNDIYFIDSIFDFIELKKEDFLLMKANLEENEFAQTSFSSNSSKIFFKTFIEQKAKEDIVINNNFFYPFLNLNEDSSYLNENEYANYYTKKSINDFINELNIKKNFNKSNLVEKFKENYFLSSRKNHLGFNHNYQNEDIYKLLFGERASKKSGLIYHCGDIKNNLYGAEKCIEFLSNLLDYEYNLESENFSNILKIGKIDAFRQMNLKYHLLSGKPNLFSCCCRIIKNILNEERRINLNTLLDDKILEEKVKTFILNMEIFDM